MGTPLKCQAVYLCLNHDHQREKTIIKIKIILFQFFFRDKYRKNKVYKIQSFKKIYEKISNKNIVYIRLIYFMKQKYHLFIHFICNV